MTATEFIESRKWNITPQRLANRLFLLFCQDTEYRDAYELVDAIERGE